MIKVKQVLGSFLLFGLGGGCVEAEIFTVEGWSHSHSAVGHILFGFITQNLKKRESVQPTNKLTIFVLPPLVDGVDYKSIIERHENKKGFSFIHLLPKPR